MELLYKDSCTLKRMRDGLLGAYVDGFAQRMLEQGYARTSIRYALQLTADFGRWLSQCRIMASQVTVEHLACYLRYRSRRGHFRTGDASILRRLLTLLIEQGVAAVDPSVEPTAAERLEAEFRRYLEQERRLAPATVFNYLGYVRRFLAEHCQDGEVRLDLLLAADVVRFVQREAARLHHAKRAKLMTTALRSLLQYARYRGLIRSDLRISVPTVANWSMASLPRALSSDELQRLLASCERESAVGRRNWAILLLLARLGLRAGEVVALALDDVDWAAGELCIRSAGTRADHLPIPQDVGEALTDYLCHARPACASRRIFVRIRAPHRGFATSAAISTLVMRALAHAGLNPAHTGAHLLRHTVATQMLRQGASLAEIGELLRHRNQQTTMIYAKVDLDLLRPLALPWPGGCAMTSIKQSIQDYLGLRRNLGFKLRDAGLCLAKFAMFLEARSAAHITVALALEWVQQSPSAQPATCAQRLGYVRGFARYHVASDPQTEIPPSGLLPFRPSRAQPYLYSDEDVAGLLQCALELPTAGGLRSWTYHCLLGLLSVTGLRIGEAIRLKAEDVDLQERVLTVRGTKFGKSRLVTIHPSTGEVLEQYRARRETFLAGRAASTFFITRRGNHLDIGDIHRTFYQLSRRIGLRGATASHGPRLHDFRHRFAVQTLLRWYRSGEDVERRMPMLSTYLGHVHVADTYWYLSACPELMGLAVARLEQRWGDPP